MVQNDSQSDLQAGSGRASSWHFAWSLPVLEVCFGLCLSSWLFLLDLPSFKPDTTPRKLVNFCGPLAITLLFSLILARAKWESLRALEQVNRGQRDALDRTLGKLPSSVAVSLLVKEHLTDCPVLFAKYMAGEREIQRNGFEGLKRDVAWPLPDGARVYDAVITMIEHAGEIRIVDQDIRRWEEILSRKNDGKQPTSTTFNYSEWILSVLRERIQKKAIREMRRIFIVNSNHINCLTSEEFGKKWEEMEKNTRVVLLLWKFEELAAASGAIDRKKIGTRVLLYPGHSVGETVWDQLRNDKDVVQCDKQLCVREYVDYMQQGLQVSSHDTKGDITLDPSKVNGMWDSFENIWEHAVGYDSQGMEKLRNRLRDIPADLQTWGDFPALG